MKIYIVLHCEIMGLANNLRVDEMVFYTADSLEKAIELIKSSRTDPWSWWEVQVQDLNSHEWPERVNLYGSRGGILKNAPYKKCEKLFLKHLKEQQ